MFAIVRDNEIKKWVKPHTAFEFEGKEYTNRWTVRWTKEEKEAFGIRDIVYGPKKDERYYWVTPNNLELIDGVPTINYTCTAKELEDREESDEDGNPLYVQVLDPTANDGEGAMVNSDQRLVTKGLKSNLTDQTKEICNSLLQESDWMIVRKYERDIDVPEEVATYRAAVVEECDRVETALAATTTLDEVIEVMNGVSWPRHYNDPLPAVVEEEEVEANTEPEVSESEPEANTSNP